MKRHGIFRAASGLVLALSWCAGSVSAATHPCTALHDDAERLACYDRTFGTPAAPRALPEDATNPRKAEPAPEQFSATVTNIDWRNGLFVVTLDNGQVWMQSERDSRIQLAAQDVVNIRRASLGSYLLSGKQGIAARVKKLR